METIKRTQISGFVPKKATFAKQNPDKSFIEKFYKINERGVPVYYGEQGGWHASFTFENESAMINNGSFLKIID